MTRYTVITKHSAALVVLQSSSTLSHICPLHFLIYAYHNKEGMAILVCWGKKILCSHIQKADVSLEPQPVALYDILSIE